MNTAREEILSRVRAAVGGAAAPVEAARTYRRQGSLPPEERVELFCRRAGDYQAEIRRIAEPELATAIAEVCRSRGAGTLVIPPDLPAAWRATGVTLVEDDGLSSRGLDAFDGALTGCTSAIAETGTIVLTAGPLEGRRALTLVPDLHICVVRESQIVELLPEALERMHRDHLEVRPITFVSGPSATSDIELSRVEGVHGPRDLIVLVVADAAT
jgi:L-lactate dehydrogenase complex protein LldG